MLDTIHIAAMTGDIKELSDAIASGVDVNKPNGLGHTPLQLASANNKANAVSALLDAKADPNIKTDGLTALDFAENNNYEDIVKLLKPTTKPITTK